MKYRIIHEVNGNNEEHWEVQFYKKHWLRKRWKNTEEWKRFGENGWYNKAEYATLEEALKVVRAHDIMRFTVAEGTVNIDGSCLQA